MYFTMRAVFFFFVVFFPSDSILYKKKPLQSLMVESPLEMSLLFTLRLLLFYSYYDCQFSIVEFNME